MKRLMFGLMAVGLLLSNSSNAQNNVWAIPNNDGSQGYYDWSQLGVQLFPTTDPDNCNLPYADAFDGYTPLNDYDSRHHGAANAITGADGELLFFIVGRVIYDSKGRTIFWGPGSDLTAGSSEICIVPDPSDCNRYYIFNDKKYIDGIPTYRATYMILDMSKIGPLNSYGNANAIGRVVDFNGNIIAEPINIPNPPQHNGSHPMRVKYAISKLDVNGERNLFVLYGSQNPPLKMQTYKIGSQGLLLAGGFNLVKGMSDRTELELFEMPTGDFKVTYTSHAYLNEIIIAPNLSTLLSFQDKLMGNGVPPNPLIPDIVNVSGIEFSNNGRYVYFTHVPANTIRPNVIDCWDTQTNTIISLPWANNNAIDSEFQYSYIESQNGKLYMVVNDKMAEISNIDDPANSSINENYLSINYLFNNNEAGYIGNNNKRYVLPDQIDGDNYSNNFINMETSCCMVQSRYDVETFEANVMCNPNFTSTTQVWTPNNNPLNGGTGAVAYVRNAINIPSGYNITIQDMVIKFHPDAEVNIKRGSTIFANGGHLIVRNTTLTVDDRCSPNIYWQGIDVEGYYLESQLPAGNNPQGDLLVFLDSYVEYARVGAEAIQKNANGSYNSSYTGGIVRSQNSTWRNNWIDIRLQNYTPLNGAVSQCRIHNNKFVTDAYLLNGPKSIIHINLFDVKRVYLQGNEFVNEVPNLYAESGRGYGVLSTNSNFYVTPYGVNPIASTFTDLTYGVYAQTGNSSISGSVLKSTFMNNQFGVTYKGMDFGRITENYFEVAENSLNVKTSGIYLQSCSGYTVEGNSLQSNQNTMSNAESYGIVVNNSGQADNYIYRNTLKDLKVGGQSQLENAPADNGPNDATGLKWQCNDFQSNVNVADLTLTSGRIDHQQGLFVGSPPYTPSSTPPQFAGARNLFSHDNTTTEFDFSVNLGNNTESFDYKYYASNQLTQPLNGLYTPQRITIGTVTYNPYIIFNYNESCPNRIRTIVPNGGGGLISNIADEKEIIFAKQAELDEANQSQQAMIDAINGNMSNGALKNYILSNSPLISDEVLIAYILSNPSNGHLMQVLNSIGYLSADVIQALYDNNALPNNQLNTYSNNLGLSPYNTIINDLTYLTNNKNYLIDDAISYFMLVDTTIVNPIDSVITILSLENNKLREQQLVDAYIYKKELAAATGKKNDLIQAYGEDNFTKLAAERIDKTYGVCVVTNIEADPVSKGNVEAIVSDYDLKMSDKAKCYLYESQNTDFHTVYIEDLIIDGVIRGALSGYGDELFENTTNNEFKLSLYPNPTTGLLNVTITGLNDGENNVIGVVNIAGELVYSQSINNTSVNIDLSNLAKGMYYVYVKTDTEMLKLEKLIIE